MLRRVSHALAKKTRFTAVNAPTLPQKYLPLESTRGPRGLKPAPAVTVPPWLAGIRITDDARALLLKAEVRSVEDLVLFNERLLEKIGLSIAAQRVVLAEIAERVAPKPLPPHQVPPTSPSSSSAAVRPHLV